MSIGQKDIRIEIKERIKKILKENTSDIISEMNQLYEWWKSEKENTLNQPTVHCK